MSFFQKTSNKIFIGLLIVIVLVGMWFFQTRNSLIMMEETINGKWAQVENQLQRRYDLIPNLVSTVKGVAKQERDVFISIAEARSKLAGATSPDQQIQASRGMESALSRLLVIVERYPQLKSDKSFNRLMDELAGTENRLSVERRRYNDSVTDFNKAIRLFPKSFVANMSGFEKKTYFEIQSDARNNINVEF